MIITDVRGQLIGRKKWGMAFYNLAYALFRKKLSVWKTAVRVILKSIDSCEGSRGTRLQLVSKSQG